MTVMKELTGMLLILGFGILKILKIKQTKNLKVMAHEINYSNGKHSFAAKGEKAWHGLGQYVSEAMTSEQAIRLGGLDYTVEKRKIYAPSIEGAYVEVPDYYSTVRTDTDTPLGVVKGRYTIVQNVDAFGFFDSIIDQGEAIFETAGSLGRGERIFVTAKLPDDMLIKGEKIEKYIILTNSHDGSSTIIAGFTNIRVVCNNTLQAALKGLDNRISIAHTASAESNLKEASRIMGISSKYMDEVNSVFDKMADVKMTDVEIMHYIESSLRNTNEKDMDKEASKILKKLTGEVFTFANTHSTQKTEAAYKTLWGAYNSISAYYTHMKNYNSSEQKMKDITYGLGYTKISRAFDLATNMI